MKGALGRMPPLERSLLPAGLAAGVGGVCIANNALGVHGHGLPGTFLAHTDLAAIGGRNAQAGFRLPWGRRG